MDGRAAPQSANEAIESGLRSIDAIADLTRQNMQAMQSVVEVVNQSFQDMLGDVADYSRQNLERTSVAARAMTTATSPAELAQLQSDFARTQFDAAMKEMAKLSAAMFRTTRELLAAQRTVVQSQPAPIPNRPAPRGRTSA